MYARETLLELTYRVCEGFERKLASPSHTKPFVITSNSLYVRKTVVVYPLDRETGLYGNFTPTHIVRFQVVRGGL